MEINLLHLYVYYSEIVEVVRRNNNSNKHHPNINNNTIALSYFTLHILLIQFKRFNHIHFSRVCRNELCVPQKVFFCRAKHGKILILCYYLRGLFHMENPENAYRGDFFHK